MRLEVERGVEQALGRAASGLAALREALGQADPTVGELGRQVTLAQLEARALKAEARFDLRVLQEEQRVWVQRNFPGREAHHPLLGAVEELGELAHHHLKAALNIRGSVEEHLLAERDAVADIVIFLSDYCSARGFDLQECVERTWAEVKQRDWVGDPAGGICVAYDKEADRT